jgi:hypothetical protein
MKLTEYEGHLQSVFSDFYTHSDVAIKPEHTALSISSDRHVLTF